MNSVIYADFESILMPCSTCDKENITTKKINKQVPCGYSLNVVTNHNKKSKQTYHRGTSTVETFCNEVREIARDLITIEKKPLEKLSNEQQSAHDNAEYCYICKKVFANSKKHRKVRDHDHYTGKYRGPAHAICNLRYTTQVDIPVFFHNGNNHDFNLTMTELAKEFRSEMKCIPLNTNKYMSFSIPIAKKIITYEPKTQNEPKNQNKPNEQNEQNEPNKEKKYKKPKKKVITYSLKFMDTTRHNNSALSTLVDTLSELYMCECEENSHKNIKIKLEDIGNNRLIRTSCKSCRSEKDQPLSTLIERFPSTFKLCKKNMEKFILLLKKCVYPYEYMDSFDKFDETTLPNIENFYSSLELSNIDVKEYNHAKNVWDIFNIKDIGDYHDLYVQADTAQLSDVFENFRSLCLREYQLDPRYYVSTPSLEFSIRCNVKNNRCKDRTV